jgi:prepilin-type N-terminal cleavage/methylation domain-containing protein
LNEKKKVKLKGFTLVELIVVIAVFGLLLAAALNLLQPVSNVFRSTATYSSGSAMIDNVSKYVEDNLRYSNRLWIFDSVSAVDEGVFVDKYTKELEGQFLLNSTAKASQKVPDEKIYTIKIDNPEITRAELEGDTLAKTYLGAGRISLWEYDVASQSWIIPGGSSSAVARNKDSAVNAAFYNEYSYTTTLEEGYSDSSKDVSNLYLKLNLFYNEKPHDASRPLINTNLNNVISFPLVNLVSNQSILEEQIFTYKPGTTEIDKENPTSVFRYKYNKGAVVGDGNTAEGVDIYFVFTKAPHIEDY